MDTLLRILLLNAVVAGVLALLVAALGRFCRRPALLRSLWLLVLLKLITPPVLPLPLLHSPAPPPSRCPAGRPPVLSRRPRRLSRRGRSLWKGRRLGLSNHRRRPRSLSRNPLRPSPRLRLCSLNRRPPRRRPSRPPCWPPQP